MKNLLLATFVVSPLLLFSQINFVINIGATTGVSVLEHNIPFHLTEMYNLYQIVRLTHDDPYSWKQFEEDYELSSSFPQFRFGFNVELSHKKIPLFLLGEANSSPSTYEKMAYGVTAGLGKDFYTENNFVVSPRFGYKVVQDNGFGAQTIVNSVRLKEARELIATFFAPDDPIGTKRGELLLFKLGLAKKFEQVTVGINGYYELDLTDKIKRQSRMTNYGLNAFVNFQITP